MAHDKSNLHSHFLVLAEHDSEEIGPVCHAMQLAAHSSLTMHRSKLGLLHIYCRNDCRNLPHQHGNKYVLPNMSPSLGKLVRLQGTGPNNEVIRFTVCILFRVICSIVSYRQLNNAESRRWEYTDYKITMTLSALHLQNFMLHTCMPRLLDTIYLHCNSSSYLTVHNAF
jgi:hypothetical protein